jgi:WD40 repeat protein
MAAVSHWRKRAMTRKRGQRKGSLLRGLVALVRLSPSPLVAQKVITLKGHTDSVDSVAFSPDGKRLASGSVDQMLKVWDAQTGQQTLTLKGHTRAVSSVAFSPDGKRLASGGGEFNKSGEVKVWDAQTGQQTLSLKGHAGFVWSVAFSPDGKRLASGSTDKTAKVWDAQTPKAPKKP